MYTKVEIFNLALGALLLTKEVSNIESDTSSENRVLRIHFNTAYRTALAEMDLDATAVRGPLELVAKCPVPGWNFAYKYPVNCAMFRRILHHHGHGGHLPIATNPPNVEFPATQPIMHGSTHNRDWRDRYKDIRSTQIPRQIGNFQNQKVIYTDHFGAWAEYIPWDFNMSLINAPAGLAIAYKLAILSAPLIAGKGAGPLRRELSQLYIIARAEAQQLDRIENAMFEPDFIQSEFVEARLR